MANLYRAKAQKQSTSTLEGDPSSGFNKIYPKSDGKWYSLDSSGVETLIGPSSSSGGGFSNVSSLVYDANGYLDTFTADTTSYNLNYDSYGDVSSVVAGSSTTTITRSPSTGQITSITTA